MIDPTKLRLRWATLKDARFLFNVKNEDEVRKFSIVTHDRIKWPDHVNWLSSVIADVDRRLYVIQYGKARVGDIRFDRTLYGIEVSVRMAKEWRNKGIASAIIPFACAGISRCYPSSTLYAKIVDGNKASAAVFRKCGFGHAQKLKGYRVLTWKR